MLLTAGSLAVIGVGAVLGLGLGSHVIDPVTVVQALLAHDPANNDHLIVVAARIPRIVLGILVGAALGLAGTLMQSLTRNPLADPGILGVNAGAAASVTAAIAYLGLTQVTQYIWFAFAGAAVTAIIVYLLGSAHRSAATPVRIALAGTAVTIAVTAVTQMIIISNEATFVLYRYWSVGALQGRGFAVILPVLPFLLAGMAGALLLIRPLNALALGEDAARALGTRIGATRLAVALVVVLLAGGATAAAGPIGFIGLASAHIVRISTGNDHRTLIPLSLLVGAAILVSADALGRALVAPAELPTGIAAALFGAPVFIALVRSRRVAAL